MITKYYISDITGELQETIWDVIKTTLEGIIYFHFLNWKWHVTYLTEDGWKE